MLRVGQRQAFGLAQPVGEKAQRPLRGHARVELPQTAGRGVARIDELLLAAFALPRIHALEIGAHHQHFAAHLQPRRRIAAQPQRQRAHGAQVRGDVLAGAAVAARRALHEGAMLVDEADGQAVEFRFAVVGDAFDAERLANAPVEGLDVVVGERVVERKHRDAVRHRPEGSHRRAADALRRRIGREQLGMLGLQRLEFAEQRIELGVGDRRRVEHVVAVVVAFDGLAQPSRALDGLGGRRHRAQTNRRCAAGPPAGMPRASMAP